MGAKTALYQEHLNLGAKIVDFAGWDMPLHYGSQVEEHYKVRGEAGMFDVSHMTFVDLKGERAREFLRYLLANNVDRLKSPGRALYTCMLNEKGGVVDDLIVYYFDETYYRMVVNAGTHDKDMAWIEGHAAAFDVSVTELTEVALLAVQGPDARSKVHDLLSEKQREKAEGLAPFNAVESEGFFISRTGYTGEDGYEVMVPADQAVDFWRRLHKIGVHPVGLGARDTLRLEAGMDLYSAEMDEETSPLEAGLKWTVAWEPQDRNFIGREALEPQYNATPARKLVGLILDDRGVLRAHQRVIVDGEVVGEVTSGSFSPTLGKAIAFARVPHDVSGKVLVEMRGKQLPARVVKPPFVRHGKACFE
ncbi:MAG: glycine cleavage system aminomethyltransferase GcvT [Thiotrichaceae bacterium]|nr:glycine cleavage system aminomethyltransferase GcvT [Thiotrichaceae bacterium]